MTRYPKLPRKLILISTKSYFSPERTIKYLQDLLRIVPQYTHPDLLLGLIPDFLTIYPCAHLLSQAQAHYSPSSSDGIIQQLPPPDNDKWILHLGAQDCSAFDSYGAYTGFITAAALSSVGVSIVELGHAERRRLGGETDAQVAAKAAAVCAHGMVPLVCIGEMDEAQEVEDAVRQLRPQIEGVLVAVPADAPVVFAYEPVWAIGQAEPAGVEYVAAVVRQVRELVRTFGAAAAARSAETRIVYGGSAGPGLWSGSSSSSNSSGSNGELGLGRHVDGMFLGRFAHEISGVEKVLTEVVESLNLQG